MNKNINNEILTEIHEFQDRELQKHTLKSEDFLKIFNDDVFNLIKNIYDNYFLNCFDNIYKLFIAYMIYRSLYILLNI